MDIFVIFQYFRVEVIDVVFFVGYFLYINGVILVYFVNEFLCYYVIFSNVDVRYFFDVVFFKGKVEFDWQCFFGVFINNGICLEFFQFILGRECICCEQQVD